MDKLDLEMRGAQFINGVTAHELARALLEFTDFEVRVMWPGAQRSREVRSINLGNCGDFMAIFLTAGSEQRREIEGRE